VDCLYLDNNSTTPLGRAADEAMRQYLRAGYGNPASAHAAGRQARRALEDARERTAALLGAHPDEVVFTSGATEANNLALLGQCGEPPGHLLASPIEHPSVLEPLRHLAATGFVLDFLPVDGQGIVPADALPPRLRPDTRLVAVMLANHETGAVQPIAECGLRIADWQAALRSAIRLPQSAFHCDATQAVGKIPVHFHELGVSTLSLSAHKFHGPQGVGALLVRRGVKLRPLARGGHQQRGLRPGTEPVALAVGLAAALEDAHREADSRRAHVGRLRGLFLGHLQENAAPVVLNGPAEGGLPHTLNLSFPGVKADALLMALDLAGVACSTGSACSSGSLLPSPVLQAMKVPQVVLHSAMRFSLSSLLSEEQITEAARRVAATVRRLRQAGAEAESGLLTQ
jgi:cysteine desulfurase